jgi:hypothetical protein
MHVNHCLIVGRVSKNGPKLSYAASGTPVCSLVLEVEELGRARCSRPRHISRPRDAGGRATGNGGGACPPTGTNATFVMV